MKIYPKPDWIRRLFKITADSEWHVVLDREDVNLVLDYMETANQEEVGELGCELGRFVLDQMKSFRHATDLLCLQEMSRDEGWDDQTP